MHTCTGKMVLQHHTAIINQMAQTDTALYKDVLESNVDSTTVLHHGRSAPQRMSADHPQCSCMQPCNHTLLG